MEWRVHQLVKKGVLERVGRGRYSLSRRSDYSPDPEPQLLECYEELSRELPFLSYCLWSTRWLNEFMVHQPGRFYLFIETEQERDRDYDFFASAGRWKNRKLDAEQLRRQAWQRNP